MSMYLFTEMSGVRWRKWLDVARKHYIYDYQDDDIEYITALAYAKWMSDEWWDEKEIEYVIDKAVDEFARWNFFNIDAPINDANIGREFMRHRNRNWDDITELHDDYIDYDRIGNDLMNVDYGDLSGYVVESELLKYYVGDEPKGIVMYRWVRNH